MFSTIFTQRFLSDSDPETLQTNHDIPPVHELLPYQPTLHVLLRFDHSAPFYPFLHSSLLIGAFVFQIMDEYGGGMSVMWIAIFEVIGIMWFYGANNFAKVSYCLTLLQYYSCNLFSGFELYAQYFHGGLLGLVQVNHPCKLGPTVNTFVADIMSWSSSGPSSRSYS